MGRNRKPRAPKPVSLNPLAKALTGFRARFGMEATVEGDLTWRRGAG